MAQHVIETFDLTKKFNVRFSSGGKSLSVFDRLLRRRRFRAREIAAVDHVSLGVDSGEILGLLGPNGAGKTTFIKLLCSMLLPDEGSASICGYDVVKEWRRVRRLVGVALPPSTRFFWFSGREYLEYFAVEWDTSPRETKGRVNELLELMGLADRADDLAQRYSRGMQCKLLLARLLIPNPPVLLLDEPTVGLDVRSARTFRDLIKRLAHEEGRAVLYTTHQMSEAEYVCDRIALLNKGRIVALDTPQNLRRVVEDEVIIKVGVTGLS